MSDTKSSDDSNDGSEETPVVSNKFANDGSFLQMFKQMQQNMKTTNASSDPNKDNKESKDSKNDKIAVNKTVDSTEEKSAPEDGGDGAEQSSSSANKPFVNLNKRKPKTLKTGLIKKQRNEESDEDDSGAQTDAWNRYMKEVRKYKEKYGDDNDKNRPLVK